jgi:DNA-binding response OmpR family regulator
LPETPNILERHLLAVISDEGEHYREIHKCLGSAFRTVLAKSADEIKSVLEELGLHAILFNLDCVGDGTRDGLDVLEEMRKVRDDVVIAAFTRSVQRTIPLEASQAGADELFLLPLNYEELKIVLL